MTESRQITFDKLLPFLLYAATGIVFYPVIYWLLGQTIAHEQLHHAFLVLVLTGALMVYERRIPLKPLWQFGPTAMNTLALAYAVLVVGALSRFSLIILLALSLAIVSLLIFIMGNGQRRFIISTIGAFTLFTGFAVLLPVMDWPLRTVAGKWSAWGLGLFGQEVQLGLYRDAVEPMLLLFNNGKPFHVAAECNGFGIITSALLMATIIVLYRRVSLLDRFASLVAALFIALVFNTLRIIVIVILAGMIPDERYMLMHEIVGLITTYGGLITLYLLLTPRSKPQSQPKSSS